MAILYEDKAYIDLILNSGVKYCSLNQARESSIENIVFDYLSYAQANDLDGIWIHLDVDVLDDNLMPYVDSRQPGGVILHRTKRTDITPIPIKFGSRYRYHNSRSRS